MSTRSMQPQLQQHQHQHQQHQQHQHQHQQHQQHQQQQLQQQHQHQQQQRYHRASTGAYSLESEQAWSAYSNRVNNFGLATVPPSNLGAMNMRRAQSEYHLDNNVTQVLWSPKSHHTVSYLPADAPELNRDDPLLNHTFLGCETAPPPRDTPVMDYMDHSNGVLTPEVSPPTTASPLSDRAWMSLASGQTDVSVQAKRMRITRALSSNPPILRSDGVRKKNAKFEIPTGRTIDTIDDLIRRADDPELIKELKTQKRLLKNREAALQSRQRKKQHTEVLEAEKSNYLKSISDLREENQDLKTRNTTLEAERAAWKTLEDGYKKRITRLEEEHTRAITNHSNEVSDLYNRINVLQETLQHMHSNVCHTGSAPLSSVPNGVTDYSSVTNPVSDIPAEVPSISWDESQHPTNTAWDNFIMDINPTHTTQMEPGEPHSRSIVQEQHNMSNVKVKFDHNDTTFADKGDKFDKPGGPEPLLKSFLFVLLSGAIAISADSKTASSKRARRPKVSRNSNPTHNILESLASLPKPVQIVARDTIQTLFTRVGLIPPVTDVAVAIEYDDGNKEKRNRDNEAASRIDIERAIDHLLADSSISVNDIVKEFNAHLSNNGI